MKNPFVQELERIKQSQQLLIIFLLLFILVFFWTIVSIFSVKNQERVSAELKTLAAPLSPNIDLETLDTIERKVTYSDAELADFPIYRILISRDGRSKFVVPIDVTLDDIDPEQRPAPRTESEPTSSPQPSASPTPTQTPQPSESPQTSPPLTE